MLNFKLWIENLFDDDFNSKEILDRIKKRGKIVNSENIKLNDKLKLYHGFNNDPKQFNYTFDSSKSEQGLIWFTHKYIRGYNPVDYAKSKGKYILVHEIPIIINKILNTYSNGEKIFVAPNENVNNIENNRKLLYFDSIIELPENWFFTYKNEKFIGYKGVLKVDSKSVFKAEFFDT